jgi:hypothetical protein
MASRHDRIAISAAACEAICGTLRSAASATRRSALPTISFFIWLERRGFDRLYALRQ